MKHFNYTVANSTKDAIKEKSNHKNAYYIAGGSNLVDMMKVGIQRPDYLVDIMSIPFKEIKKEGNSIRLGALVSNTAAAEAALVLQNAPLVTQSITKGATQQIRNMATIGGNLMQEPRCPHFYDLSSACGRRTQNAVCPTTTEKGDNRSNAIFGINNSCNIPHPSDMAVGMLALRSNVILQGKKEARKMPLGEFYHIPSNESTKITYLKEGELITAVEIPLEPGFTHSAYLKVRDRKSYAFALISGAVAFNLKDNLINESGIAAGGVGTIPWRFKNAEQFLKGKMATVENFKKAAAIAIQGAKTGKHNKFKVRLLERILVRTMIMAKNTPYGTN
ncbi:xanthine dehydrogenase family protein subunit M [Aquimarina sp. U1-2]|uniref:FAD binding domain-containing protein n=1 Tax=Aquimarina sp. U1-2 TaxID=2823141 RepID=UPI001AED0198|nr:xanthine dehydrogenase family protein subunit M [Aquimarina sp. U1-2]MBP2831233.1 xanthine dehydrogenase family protein subunit M [Aquimarina sp. U1-2]